MTTFLASYQTCEVAGVLNDEWHWMRGIVYFKGLGGQCETSRSHSDAYILSPRCISVEPSLSSLSPCDGSKLQWQQHHCHRYRYSMKHCQLHYRNHVHSTSIPLSGNVHTSNSRQIQYYFPGLIMILIKTIALPLITAPDLIDKNVFKRFPARTCQLLLHKYPINTSSLWKAAR